MDSRLRLRVEGGHAARGHEATREVREVRCGAGLALGGIVLGGRQAEALVCLEAPHEVHTAGLVATALVQEADELRSLRKTAPKPILKQYCGLRCHLQTSPLPPRTTDAVHAHVAAAAPHNPGF